MYQQAHSIKILREISLAVSKSDNPTKPKYESSESLYAAAVYDNSVY